MKSLIILTVLAIQLVNGAGYYPVSNTKVDLGGALKHSLLAMVDVPLTSQQAIKEGWKKISSCDSKLGNLYAKNGGETLSSPLGVYYTNAGQIAGIKINIWGSGKIGDAALPKLVQQGYWIKEYSSNGQKRWSCSLSFRSPNQVCSGTNLPGTIGNQIVINQQGIAKAIPLTQAEAVASKFQPGACMRAMGQHHLFDLETAPNFTFKAENLMPVIPMYHMNGAKKGQIATVFFTTPVCQNHDWGNWGFVPGFCGIPNTDNFFANPSQATFCKNWCNKGCNGSWGNDAWSLLHFFFNDNPMWNVQCSSAAMVWDKDYIPGWGRQCAANTPDPR